MKQVYSLRHLGQLINELEFGYEYFLKGIALDKAAEAEESIFHWVVGLNKEEIDVLKKLLNENGKKNYEYYFKLSKHD